MRYVFNGFAMGAMLLGMGTIDTKNRDVAGIALLLFCIYCRMCAIMCVIEDKEKK